MATITRFEDIEAWKKGRELRRGIYAHSKRGEFARDYGLKDQIRRAAVSVTSNIAEGFEREGNNEFIQLLSHAKGSCGEVCDQLYVALDEDYISQQDFDKLYNEARAVSRLIAGFMKYLRESSIRGNKFKRGAQPQTSNIKPETLQR
ncbi:MAG: four helix bundle protein [Verrucomicrobia bacterium]|nr:four helix bundle protein [Verrucomicrobiota bacterium]